MLHSSLYGCVLQDITVSRTNITVLLCMLLSMLTKAIAHSLFKDKMEMIHIIETNLNYHLLFTIIFMATQNRHCQVSCPSCKALRASRGLDRDSR